MSIKLNLRSALPSSPSSEVATAKSSARVFLQSERLALEAASRAISDAFFVHEVNRPMAPLTPHTTWVVQAYYIHSYMLGGSRILSLGMMRTEL